ncbi:MAG: TIM-barrel domain-containing protein [Bacteroidota bacterium]
MKLKHLLLFLAVATFACQRQELPFTTTAENVYQFKADGGTYSIAALSDDIIKVSYSDGENTVYGDRVYAPVMDEAQTMSYDLQEDAIVFSTATTRVDVTLNPFKVAFYNDADELKLMEELGYGKDGDTTSFRFYLADDEKIYGTGARAIPLNRRGYKFQSYNQPNYGYGEGAEFLNYSIPHIYSSNEYMLLIDNPARGWFDIGKTENDIFEFSSLGGNQAYYFVNGDNYNELIDSYTDLTGKQPLPPLWMLGHLQSRFGYRTEAQADSVLDLTLGYDIPVDAIILDIFWFGKEIENGKMGQLAWDLEAFPAPEEMIAGWRSKGVKTITVSEPFFTKKSQNYAYLDENGLMGKKADGTTMDMPNFYFGNGGLIDIFQQEARDWFWERYKEQKAIGVEGWWGDLGEPEMHPDSMVHANGLASEVHGVYGHEWARTLYDGYAKDFPNERFCMLGRAGYAGSQRYGLIPWSGDVSRTWSGYKPQIPIMLGMAMSGLAYMHADAGGFTGQDQDYEAYMRWMQMAIFSPIFRPHSNSDVPAELALWDEKTRNTLKEYIELRYRMMPYIYNTAWQNSTTGIPLTRPLFTQFDNVPESADNQYMWGDALMIAPILEQGQITADVYLPEGSWYNFWTGEKYEGGKTITMDAPVETIPVLVKGNELVCMTDLVKTTDNYQTTNLDLHYYLDGKDMEHTLYFDDTKTNNAYQKGAYQMLRSMLNLEDSSLSISFNQSGNGYEGAPDQRNGRFVIYGITNQPSSVKMGDQNIAFEWKEELNQLKFEQPISTEEEIVVTYSE